MTRSKVCSAVGLALLLGTSAQAFAQENSQSIDERLAELEREIAELRQRNEELQENVEEVEEVSSGQEDGINFGGAVRFQYVLAEYDRGQERRGGDLEFDIFRINVDGRMGDVILSAEYRWFEYMQSLRHAYFGYDFTDEWQGQVGIVIQPFGIMPYNSHSYFFNSTFYVGLEDNPGAGVRFKRRTDDWDLDFAFILNDELGGSSGAVRSLADRYNYDVVGIRLPGEGIYDDPTQLAGENNTVMVRVARKFHLDEDRMFEIGVSGQHGSFQDGQFTVGDRRNWAIHGVYNTGPWEFHLQYAGYDYDIDMDNEGVIVGAYAYFDTIPTSADIFTGNIAYNLPVQIGPISHLQFYNNHSIITNKEGLDDDTVMNVLGMAVTAGGMYTYVDLVNAKNQPFVNGSIGADGGSTETRFNINFGYYF